MKTALNKIFSSEGLRKSITLVSTSLVATGIAAIALIIFSRLLGPEKFGEFSVGTAIIFILLRLTDLGATQALLKFIPVQKSSAEKSKLFFQLSQWRLKLAGVIIPIALIMGLIALWQGYSIQPVMLVSAILLTLVIMFYEHLYHFLSGLGLIAQVATMNGVQAITKLFLAIVFSILNLTTTLTSFLAYGLAPLLGVIVGLVSLPTWSKKIQIINQPLPPQVKNFISHAAVGVIAMGVMENISILQLNGILSKFETGVFSGIFRISLFIVLGGTYLSQVLFPRVAQYIQPQTQRQYLKKAILFIGALGLSLLLYLPLNSLVLRLTLGTAYLVGTQSLLVLVIAAIIYTATIPLAALFYAGNKHWYFSLTGILQILIVVIGNLIFVPKFGLLGAAGVILLARGVVLVLTGVLAIYDVFLLSNQPRKEILK